MDTMKMTSRNRIILLLVATVAMMVASCTAVPIQLAGEFDAVTPASVQAQQFGAKVRWGGVLVATRNEQNKTCFEVLSRALDKYMRPVAGDDTTLGRFIACTEGFHDPEIYQQGREVTIVGQIQSIEGRKIEEFDYRYPVLAVMDMVLWEQRKTVIRYDNFYGPGFYPYYWGGHGYWGGYWGGYPHYPYAGPGYGMGGGYMYPRELVPGPAVIITDDPAE
jgi:outer membrane lipoprotein